METENWGALQCPYHITMPRNATVSLLCSFPKPGRPLCVNHHCFWVLWWEMWLFWLFLSEGQNTTGNQVLYPPRTFSFWSWAWWLSWQLIWRALCQLEGEIGQFHHLLTILALMSSMKRAFWLSVRWEAHSPKKGKGSILDHRNNDFWILNIDKTGNENQQCNIHKVNTKAEMGENNGSLLIWYFSF